MTKVKFIFGLAIFMLSACSFGVTYRENLSKLKKGMKPAAAEALLKTSTKSVDTISVKGKAYRVDRYTVEYSAKERMNTSSGGDYDASGTFVGSGRGGYSKSALKDYDLVTHFLVFSKDSLMLWGTADQYVESHDSIVVAIGRKIKSDL